MHCSCWALPPCVKSTAGLSRSLHELGGGRVLSSCHSRMCAYQSPPGLMPLRSKW